MVGRSVSAALVALAAMCWGLAGGFASVLMDRGWDEFVISFYRGAIGLVAVLVWLMLRPHGSGLTNRRLWFWSVLAGLGVTGNFTFYFISIDQSNIPVAATLMYCAPVFVYLVSFGLRLEKPTLQKWAAIAVVMLGIVLLTRVYNLGASDVTLHGVVAGLLAGVSYAIFIFGFKYASSHGSPQAILSIAFAVPAALLVWLADTGRTLSALSTPDWPLFITLGILGAGLSFMIYVFSLNHVSPVVASIVAMVEPVTASLFGVVFLSQTLAGLQVLGMGLIIVTITALSVYSSSQRYAV